MIGPKAILDIAIDMAGEIFRSDHTRNLGAGVNRAAVRENLARHYWDNRPFDYAGIRARRHELGVVRAKRWKKAHPGIPFTEAPRHIIENQKAR